MDQNKSPGEFELRDDDRNTPYRRSGRGRGYGAMLVIALAVIGLFIGYGLLHRGQVPDGGQPQATAGSVR